MTTTIPVITIDGPSASGKGTLASALATALGFYYLDSGAIYRALALAVKDNGLDVCNEPAIAKLAETLPLSFLKGAVFLAEKDITQAIRHPDIGNLASHIATMKTVRAALLLLQRNFRQAPGLIADGRDMGTTVFSDAVLKVFLTASAEIRARRRHEQLTLQGMAVDYDVILQDLLSRDARDLARTEAPLRPAEGALLLDNSQMSIDETVVILLNKYHEKLNF